ncbi:hypothetical protein [Mycolicibacterium tusciae]|uniref:hypothetical protein n=1 Tax=Mycolicibacterium tusciae TaxID=75922 RepID=UPI0002D80D7A|nr:hypothetical protein [Mycolicibacterium tusciae]
MARRVGVEAMSSVVAQVLPAHACCDHSPHAQDALGAHVDTSTALAQARKDLQYAVFVCTDTHRRRHHALSARDEAATVLVAGDATAVQLRYARHYFDGAQRFADAAAANRGVV